MTGDVTYPFKAMLFGQGVYEVVSEMSPIVEFSFSGVPSHHKTCFLRLRIVFWAMA